MYFSMRPRRICTITLCVRTTYCDELLLLTSSRIRLEHNEAELFEDKPQKPTLLCEYFLILFDAVFSTVAVEFVKSKYSYTVSRNVPAWPNHLYISRTVLVKRFFIFCFFFFQVRKTRYEPFDRTSRRMACCPTRDVSPARTGPPPDSLLTGKVVDSSKSHLPSASTVGPCANGLSPKRR